MRSHSGRRDASRVIADGAGYLTIQTVRAAQTARGYLAVRSRIDDEIVLVVPAERAGKPRDIHRRLGAQLERQLGGGQSSPTSLGDLDFGLNQARVAALARQSIQRIRSPRCSPGTARQPRSDPTLLDTLEALPQL